MPNYTGKRPHTRRIVVWLKGKAHERVIEGTKTEGDLYEAKFRIELEANVHATRVAPRFAKLCTDKYSPFARINLAESTWRARSNIIVSLVDFFGSKTTTEIGGADVEAYKRLRLEESELGAASMNTEIRTLLYVLKWAGEQGYPVKLPAVRYLPEPEGRIRVWTPEETNGLLAVARTHDPRLLPVLVFLVNTGCRKGESIAAEWSWVDTDAGMLRIPANKYWRPKNGRAREVPLSDAVRAILSGAARSERWVFPNRDNAPFSFFPDARFEFLQREAGLEGGIHTLRHTFASLFLQQVPDLFLLGKILGHTTQRMTEIYSHLLPGHLEKGRNAVNFGAPTMVRTMAAKTAPAKKRA